MLRKLETAVAIGSATRPVQNFSVSKPAAAFHKKVFKKFLRHLSEHFIIGIEHRLSTRFIARVLRFKDEIVVGISELSDWLIDCSSTRESKKTQKQKEGRP